MVVLLQLSVLDDVGSVRVDEGVEAKSIAPTRAEVFYLYPSVPAQNDGNDTQRGDATPILVIVSLILPSISI